jgi:hypothetical protein
MTETPPPVTALVRVDASDELREWTSVHGKLVLRLATGDGAPAVGDRERAASFVVLRGRGPGHDADAYMITSEWEDIPAQELTDLGYPDARHAHHVVADVEPLSRRQRQQLAIIASEVAAREDVYRHRTPFGLPFVVWIDGEADRYRRNREEDGEEPRPPEGGTGAGRSS